MVTIKRERRKGYINLKDRPSKYDPKFDQMLVDYFSDEQVILKTETRSNKDGLYEVEVERGNKFPTLAGFCASIGIHRATLYEWTKKHPSLNDAYRMCKDLQEDFLISNSLDGHYNATFAGLTAKNIINWRDKVDSQVTQKTLEQAVAESFEEDDE